VRLAFVLFKREMREVLRDINLLLPVIVLPVLLALSASIGIVAATRTDTPLVGNILEGIDLDRLPPGFLRLFAFSGLTVDQKNLLFVLKVIIFPLFWVIPVALTSTIAADSFVGEKERRTMEPLLATPMRNLEMLAGKLAIAVVPAVVGSWLSFLLFGFTVVRAINPRFPYPVFPDGDWLFSALVLVPLLALLSASIAALISTRVATYRAAYQLNGLIVLPVLLVFIPQTMGLYFISPRALIIAAIGLLLMDLLFVGLSLRVFDREKILSGQK
jgi:ABC-2 type transport system permease protein